MKKLFLIFFIVLASNSLFANSIIDSTLLYKKFKYKNGRIASEGYLKNNKPQGFWISYYQTGIIKSEGNWNNNKLDSIWIFYDQIGDTLEKINYYQGKKNGFHIKYSANEVFKNSVVSKELYVNGFKNGKSTYYYNTGEVYKIISFTNNQKQGLAYEYNKQGLIITVLRYKRNEIVEYQKINRYDTNNLKTGIWLTYYQNEIIKEERNYKDGKLNGLRKIYDQYGKLIETYNYINGEVDLTKTEIDLDIDFKEEYDQNQNLIFRGSYKGKTPIGIHRFFNSKGQVIKSITYDIYGNKSAEGIVLKNGRRKGKWKNYYENGNVKSEGEYLNGNKNKQWKFYYENGKIQQVGSFSNGKYTGSWKWYYNTGELLKEEFYIYGLLDGESFEYDVYGNVIAKGNYMEGMKEGEWFYVIGDQKFYGKYLGGEKDGEWKSYYLQEETISFKGNYLRGFEDGKHVYYYPDGTLMEERYFSEGKKVKSWSKYNEEGNLVIVVKYKNGKEYRINGIRVNLNKIDE